MRANQALVTLPRLVNSLDTVPTAKEQSGSLTSIPRKFNNPHPIFQTICCAEFLNWFDSRLRGALPCYRITDSSLLPWDWQLYQSGHSELPLPTWKWRSPCAAQGLVRHVDAQVLIEMKRKLPFAPKINTGRASLNCEVVRRWQQDFPARS